MARPYAAKLDAMPIPFDAVAYAKWPPIMQELAAHIGAYDTLQIVEAFPGQDIYISAKSAMNPFISVLGTEKAAIITYAFCGERISIPPGKRWVDYAKRQAIIASVRQKRLTVVEAAAMLGKQRSYMYRLLNKTAEGLNHQPLADLKPRSDPRQIEMFLDDNQS